MPSRDTRDSVQTGVILVLLAAAVILARRNLRSGRADRRGAFRLAVMIFAIFISSWVLLPHLSRLRKKPIDSSSTSASASSSRA